MSVSKYAGRGGYPDEIKMTVVQQWLALGNLKLVAANTDVPIATIKYWRGEPWWKDYENELRAGRRFEVDKKLSNVIDKAFAIMEDRLDHGDWIFDQTKGEIVRRPVGFKDANNDATKSIQDQLAMLANEFAKFNGRSKASAETIEFKEMSGAKFEGMVEQTRESREDENL